HVETPPPLHERDDGCHRQRPLHELIYGVADRDVTPVPRLPPARRFPAVGRRDRVDVTLGVARRLGRVVLAALAGGVALGAEAPGVGLAPGVLVLVPERRRVGLLDRPARKP